jgi:O-antigen ligase
VSAPFEGDVGEPNTLGGYLVLMLSTVLGLSLTCGTKKQKLILLFLGFLILISLAATLSRSSWLSLVPMVLTLFYFSNKKMTIILAVLMILLISPFILPKSVTERVLFTFTQPKETGQITFGNVRIDTSTSARFEAWKNVLEKDFIQQPILGYGVTGYRFLDTQYARVLAETGLAGMITFLILLYSIYMNTLRTFRTTSDSFFKGLCLGYLAGFIAMLTHAIGTNTFIIVRIMEPFWFLTAIVIMIPIIEEDSKNFQPPMVNPQ